jgi:NAD(P)-dependent dehydrogenase (short-subunit alcohol dehydrogenase family)
MKNILVIGSVGQIGSELTLELRKRYGNNNVVAGYRKTQPSVELAESGPLEVVDATDIVRLAEVVKKYKIDTIYNLAALLSAVAEKNPQAAWNVGVNGAYNVLEVAREYKCAVFFPSSIGAFGLSTPLDNTPQDTIQRPGTMYGVTKVAAELLSDYYFKRFGVDTRGVRFPGIISNVTLPGGGTIRWNHLFNNRVFSNTSLIYSEYNLNIYEEYRSSNDKYELKYTSGIYDVGLKYDLEYHHSPEYSLRTGMQSTHHYFLPSAIVEIDDNVSHEFKSKTDYTSFESAVYVENHFNFKNIIQVNAGFRMAHFIADKNHYFSPEPRLSVNYLFGKNISFKAAYSVMNQYIHLLSNTGIGLPTDLWVPSTDRIAPQHSSQISAGIAKELVEKGIQVSLEGYFKKSKNILGYKPGSSFLLIDDPTEVQSYTWQDNVTAGRGESYGAELLLHKKEGRTSGWIGYTLSWTQLQFDEINFGKKYWARYDRRHDIGIVVIHELNKRITLSGSWVYGTGNAVTLPLGSYYSQSHDPFESMRDSPFYHYYSWSEIYDYGEINSFRMKPYHRLDIAVQFHKKMKKHERIWELGLYNAYNRLNPFFYFISREYDWETNTETSKLKQVSIFPIIPSVTYNFKF